MFISSYTIHTHFPTPLSNPYLSQPSTYFTLFHTLCVTHILYTHISYPHAHTHFFCHPSLSTPPCTQPSLSSHSSYSTPTSPFLLYLMSIQPPRGLSEIHQGPKTVRVQTKVVLCLFSEGDVNSISELNSAKRWLSGPRVFF